MWPVALRGAPVRAPARLLHSRAKRTSGSRRAVRVSAKLYPGDETRDTDGKKKSSTLDALDNILPSPPEDPSPRVDEKEIQTPPKPMGGTREERAAREVADLVLSQRPKGAPPAVQALLGAEAVALLPPFARSMLGLERPGLAAIPARAATWAR